MIKSKLKSINRIFGQRKPALAFCIFIHSLIPAYAQSNQELIHMGKPYSTAIESSGLYQKDNPNSLGNGVYHGADRKSIVILLKQIVNNTPWITQNTLIRKLLLTQADTGILINTVPLSPENDLLAGRLKALLSLGMQNQAFQLYTNLENSEGHRNLHYYGIISMLMSNEKTLACVEIKTLFPEYKDQIDWQFLNTYCSISLSDTKISQDEEQIFNNSILKTIYNRPDFVFPYTPTDFESLPLRDKAFLIAEKSIGLSKFPISNVKDIPASHVQALLSDKTLSTSQRLMLSFRGVSVGVIEPESLSGLYYDISKKIEDQKRIATDLEKIAVLFVEMEKSWLKTSKAKFLKEVLDYAHIHGHAALAPFMRILVDIGLENLEVGFKDVETLIHASIIGGVELPFDWSYSLAQMAVENIEEKKLQDKLIASSFLLSDPSKASKKKRSAVVDIIAKSKSAIINNVKNIIENIDIQLNNHANVALFYENKLKWYENKSYKMPSYTLLNAIKDASDSSLATVILMSNIALEKQEQGGIYAGTLDYISKALNEIGLTKEARYILSEYIIRAEEL